MVRESTKIIGELSVEERITIGVDELDVVNVYGADQIYLGSRAANLQIDAKDLFLRSDSLVLRSTMYGSLSDLTKVKNPVEGQIFFVVS